MQNSNNCKKQTNKKVSLQAKCAPFKRKCAPNVLQKEKMKVKKTGINRNKEVKKIPKNT